MKHPPILHCTLTVLSPLHLGTGEVYEPMEFVLDTVQKTLHAFDPMDFAMSLDAGALQRFKEICRKGTVDSILELYRFYSGNMETGKRVARRVAPVCKGLAEKYQGILAPLQTGGGAGKGFKGAINEMQISRTAWLAYDGRPYIPGSAIKGAIRTAWLNSAVKQAGPRFHAPPGNTDRDAKNMEQEVLGYRAGKFENDPFRMLHVSDFLPAGEAPTRIVYGVNVRKNAKDAQLGPPQLLETVRRDTVFHGTVSVVEPERGSGIQNPLKWNNLDIALRAFYPKEKEREDKDLARIGAGTAPTPNPGEAGLLRLGRHSGAECLTIEGIRQIKIMKKDAVTGELDSFLLDHATTLWLAGETSRPTDRKALLPFGWVALRTGGEELVRECAEKEKEWKAKQPAPSFRQAIPAGAVSRTPSRQGAEETKPAPKPREYGPKDLLLVELERMKTADPGKIGSIIQRIPKLESPEEKAEVARAIQEKMGKDFNKYKRKDEILAWIEGKGE
jgi:CRISPR-associated protein Csm5